MVITQKKWQPQKCKLAVRDTSRKNNWRWCLLPGL